MTSQWPDISNVNGYK